MKRTSPAPTEALGDDLMLSDLAHKPIVWNNAVSASRRHRAGYHKETDMINSTDVKVTELTFDDLDRASGGIIIVSGHRFQLSHRSTVLDRVALNPQPLPPKMFSFGR
ncbi:hypothetical protein [Bradyrhizobium sp. JYMT SZCCT0428]|uniref:hypothetical protein n=1 Tax=Bradyrhizobium sp. JYMT SZCCT0428 TaxID=2807673 RepID=UPI001BAD1FA1|nr:hypothetical protein [Bradyrhizobium sp. JYMT SZCCT0428]MBR1157030.1 hypothetical protein [Bradyrhizobium sp. JYMT SZCCT0428]